tara:strand:- start:989 stop:1591 length:603 start_codon:yes stop_codon:yes gene_type:complete
MDRKKKIRIIQLSLLLIGTIIIFLTYSDKNKNFNEQIISKAAQEKVNERLADQTQDGDVFYNIEYSGLDLAGNRYILKSKEAINSKANEEITKMKSVEANFFFKDDTILRVKSEKGIYNNKTLDMVFTDNVEAFYEENELFATKAEYSNSKSFLIISGDVKVKSNQGTIVADSLLFDIKKQTLNIASLDNDKINASINLK